MNLDYIIVLIYLLITLVVGFWQGSGVRTLRDYATANLNYTTFAIIATLSATLIGGGTTFGVAEKVYKYGIVYVFVVGGAALNQIFIGQCIVPRIKNFKNYISIGELMRKFYGKDAQIITGVCATLVSLGFVSTQISAIGNIINHFLGIKYFHSVLIGYGLVVFYSAFGGMRSVVATDIIQFAILIIAIPIICTLGINRLGGMENFIAAIPESSLNLDFFNADHINEFLIFLIVGAFIPSFLQRILIARSNSQARKAITINGIISFPFYMIIGFIGLISLEIAPNINANQPLPYLIQNILPIGIKGLIIAGMLSVLMSSADSELNVAGVSIMNDIFRNIFKINLPGKKEVFIARVITSILGIGTIIVALNFKNIIDIMLYAFVFWAPTIIVPLTVGLYGFRVNKFIFYAGLVVSILSVTIFNQIIKDYIGLDPIISSILITLVFYTAYFLITDKRKLKNINFNIKHQVRIRCSRVYLRLQKLKQSFIRKFFTHIVQADINKNYYEFFGIFCFLFYLIPYFLWSHADKNYFLIIILRIIACVLSILLIIQDSWKKNYRKWLPLYWNITLIYCLPFVSTYMLLHNHLELPWVMNSIIAMFLLVLLVDWFSFVFILLIGIILAIIAFYCTNDVKNHNIYSYNIIFGGLMYLFSLVIGTIFLFKREQSENIIIEKNASLKKLNRNLETLVSNRTSHLIKALNAKKEFLNNMSHEIRTPVHGILNISKELYKNWSSFKESEKKNFIKILAESGDRLANLVNNVLDFSKIQTGQMKYSFQQSSLKRIIDESISYAKNFANLNVIHIEILTNKFQDKSLICDEEKLKIALQNILTNAIKYGSGKININIEVNEKQIIIKIQDNGIGIPVGEEEKIFEPFVESSITKSKAGGKGLGLALCREIIKAHNGEVTAKNLVNKEGSIFKVKLPINKNQYEKK